MPPEEPGRVLLVGAGPGSADLLTVRALRAIEAADVVLHDALVCDEVVALAARARIKLRTGKRAGKRSMDQATINALMLRFARRGLAVVRLKGGDPSVFGRSGEEAAFLRAHGVAVEVVPGITAASAAAGQFGFPLTHRGERVAWCWPPRGSRAAASRRTTWPPSAMRPRPPCSTWTRHGRGGGAKPDRRRP